MIILGQFAGSVERIGKLRARLLLKTRVIHSVSTQVRFAGFRRIVGYRK
jgi:hypothetical protein